MKSSYNGDEDNCPICGRLFPKEGTNVDEHHLIPKTFKGKRKDDNMVRLHKVCHRKIHSVFSERELLNYYHTVKRIREHEEIHKFIRWVSKKPPEFYDGSKETKQRKRKRR